MGFRFRKSVKIAPGVRLNVGSKSVGISAGVKGARVSTNTRTGTRATISAPGTGLSYSTKIGGSSSARYASSATQSAPLLVDGDATVVQVSANTVEWPCLCPCCGARFEAPIGANQIAAGVYAIKVAVKEFSPSYCQRCLNHQNAFQEAQAVPNVPEAGAFWGCTVPILFVLWLVAVVMASGAGASFLIICAITVVTCVLGREFRKSIAKQQEEKELQREGLVEQARQMQKPECTCTGPAVALIASQGSLRQFAFVNPKLATVFAQLNAKKVVH